MHQKTEPQLLLGDWAARCAAAQKLSPADKTQSVHVNGKPMDSTGIHKQHDSYSVWKRMRERCTSPNCPKFKDYGGRGITVCKRWDSFELFVLDMGPRPSSKHQIDRIENDGNYEPGNCKWATNKENCRHRRSSRYLAYNGEILALCVWADKLGMSEETIASRIKRGWSVDKSLSLPRQDYSDRMRKAWQTRRQKVS